MCLLASPETDLTGHSADISNVSRVDWHFFKSKGKRNVYCGNRAATLASSSP